MRHRLILILGGVEEEGEEEEEEEVGEGGQGMNGSRRGFALIVPPSRLLPSRLLSLFSRFIKKCNATRIHKLITNPPRCVVMLIYECYCRPCVRSCPKGYTCAIMTTSRCVTFLYVVTGGEEGGVLIVSLARTKLSRTAPQPPPSHSITY